MTNDELEIKILEEDIAPLVPENPAKPDVKERAAQAASQVGQQVTEAAQQAWQSDTRKKVTGVVGRGAKKMMKKGSAVVTDAVVRTAERQARERATAVQQRIQETDWKEASKEGAATGLRWLSQKLAKLATRFTPPKDDREP